MRDSGFDTGVRGLFGVRELAVVLALLVGVGVLVGLGVGVLVGAFAGVASAGDQPAVFTIEPEEVEVEPGETVELDVVVYNHGPLQGEGLSEIAFDVSYDPEVVSEAAVEHDEWLLHGGGEGSDGDAEIDASAAVDEDAGLISVTQEREPAENGVYGHGTAATISLTIDENAAATTFEVAFEDTMALIPSGMAHFVWAHEATVSVGDGGSADDGTDSGDDGSAGDDVDGVTLADDADLSGTENGDETGTAEHGDETTVPVPGFGVLVAVFALVAAFVLVFRVAAPDSR